MWILWFTVHFSYIASFDVQNCSVFTAKVFLTQVETDSRSYVTSFYHATLKYVVFISICRLINRSIYLSSTFLPTYLPTYHPTYLSTHTYLGTNFVFHPSQMLKSVINE